MAASQLSCPISYLVDKNGSKKISLKGEMIIGRDTGLAAQGVSRQHCAIKFYGDSFYIADMSSTYGTFINDQRIAPNQWQLLSAGDSLRIGVLDFQLEFGAMTGSGSAPAKPKLVPQPEPQALTEDEPFERDVESTQPAVELKDEARFFRRAISSLGLEVVMSLSLAFVFYAFFKIPADGWGSYFNMILTAGLIRIWPMLKLGQSAGKWVLDLKVVADDGSELTRKMILMREGAGFLGIPAAIHIAADLAALAVPLAGLAIHALGILGLLAWSLKERKPYWDILAGTRVIDLTVQK